MSGLTTDTLDPINALNYGASFVASIGYGQIRNNLFEIWADDQIASELVESYNISADAMTWQFELRRGIEFHNGKTLTSEDVALSLLHHFVDGEPPHYLNDVKRIGTNGDTTILIELARPTSDLPALLADPRLQICPSNGNGIDWRSGIGTGGYILQEIEFGVQAITRRNPNYWKEDAAYFESVTTMAINDPNALVTALISGDIDAIDLPPRDTALVNDTSGVQVVSVPSKSHITFPMLTIVQPFDSPDVRLAVKYACNREEIVEKVFLGNGVVGNDTPISPHDLFAATSEELPQRNFDPDRAAFHLKKAGLSGLSIDLSASTAAFAGAIDAAILFSNAAKMANIDVNVTREPVDGYYSDVWRKRPFVASSWGGRASPNQIFEEAYWSDGLFNESFWKNERFDDLLTKASVEPSFEARREIFVELQRIIHNDGGSVIPVFQNFTFGISDSLHVGPSVGSTYPFDNYKNVERWAFTKTGGGSSSCRFDEKWCKKKDQCIPKEDACE